MTKELTEAAGLYWKDLDVLEQARSEFVAYLDTVYETWWKLVRQLWQENPRTSGQKMPRLGKAQKNSGQWPLDLPGGGLKEMHVFVRDPRRLEASGQFCVELAISKVGIMRLKGRGETVLTELGEVARQARTDFSWHDPNRLSKQGIGLNPDDAVETGKRLGKEVFKNLELLVRLGEKVKKFDS